MKMTGPVDTDALRTYAQAWLAEDHETIGPNLMLITADEIDRLGVLIENAPHALECNEGNLWRDGTTMPCSCWKADVL